MRDFILHQPATQNSVLKLGSAVSLEKHSYTWFGFVVALDRHEETTDVLVFWNSRPAHVPDGGYGVFKADQLSWDAPQMTWHVDPSSVPG